MKPTPAEQTLVLSHTVQFFIYFLNFFFGFVMCAFVACEFMGMHAHQINTRPPSIQFNVLEDEEQSETTIYLLVTSWEDSVCMCFRAGVGPMLQTICLFGFGWGVFFRREIPSSQPLRTLGSIHQLWFLSPLCPL